MRLFRAEPAAEADVRPTLLGVVTLLFLLLFFLLTTSSGQRLGVIDLRLAQPGEAAPVPHAGLVKEVTVFLRDGSVHIEYAVQSTDIAAVATTTELRAVEIPDAAGHLDRRALTEKLLNIHAIDPTQDRATIEPNDATETADLIAVLDAVRGAPGAPCFPNVGVR